MTDNQSGGHLTQLGQQTVTPNHPDAADLERIPNPHPGKHLLGALCAAGVHLNLPRHRTA